jgi:hypothetical protein
VNPFRCADALFPGAGHEINFSFESAPAPYSLSFTHRSWRAIMLETIAVILIVLWLLGLVTSTTMGGLIHVLLVIAVVVVLIRVIQGRRI